MKSLEIVNIYLEELGLEDCKCILFYRDYIQQIIQDLEILELLKNKIVNIEILKFLLEEYGDDKALEIYNLDNIKLTKEQLLKLKQWLDECH